MTDRQDKLSLDRIAERMEGVSDELRVRAHLASLDAKDAWDRAHFERVTDELTRALEEAKLQLHLAGLDAKDAWGKLSERLFELRSTTGVGLDTTVHATTDALREFLRAIGRKADFASPGGAESSTKTH